MKVFRTPGEHVVHVLALYRRGVLGPSAMWLGIAEALRGTAADAVLEALPSAARDELAGLFRGLPPAAYARRGPNDPDDAEFRAACVAVVRWCEQHLPSVAIPRAGAGMTHVRIEGDDVVTQ